MKFQPSFPVSLFILACFSSFLLLGGCKKEEAPPPAPTNEDKIVGAWMEKELWTDDDLDGTFVLHNEPCDGDTQWAFNADGSLHYQDLTPCDVPFTLDLMGKWEILGDGTHLQIILNGNEDEPIDLMIDAISDQEITMHTIWPSAPAPAEDKIILRR